MRHVTFAMILVSVVIAAAATLWLALAVAGDLMPVWMAVLGPLLLLAALVAHLRGRR